MGPRARPEDRARCSSIRGKEFFAAPIPERSYANLTGSRFLRSSCVGKADALRILRRELDRDPSRNDRQIADRSRRDFARKNTITLSCNRRGAPLFSATRVSSDECGFIMANPSRTGGAPAGPTSLPNHSIARSVDAFLDRHARAPIKAVLLLQSGFAGIGNWMADEILWRAKIAPLPRCWQLCRQRNGLACSEKRALSRANRSASSGPISAIRRRDWLIHQKWKREGVCPRHRTPLRKAMIGGRTTAWCSKCQK